MDSISSLTRRRFLLGRQGLWPGRRFKGLRGVEPALRLMESLQLDPLCITARSQDIAMHGRVLDYIPEHLYRTAYDQRKAFDYGGLLCMYPMQEFPYWTVPMRRRRDAGMRYESFTHPPQELIDFVLGELRDRGPLANRDIEGTRVQAWSYRGRKEASIALYYLWLAGEVMISSRRGFDRVYDLRERVLPAEHDREATAAEAARFFGLKTIAHHGLLRENGWRVPLGGYLQRDLTRAEAKELLEDLVAQGLVSRLFVEGSKEAQLCLSADLPDLAALEAGRIPKKWKPTGPSTEEEVTFLAPLEIVSARGRARKIFDFEYLWEVYKPVHQRRWGYYTLPILYGDDLVARLDPKLDRKTGTLQVLGFWLEEDTRVDDAFLSALAKGLKRFGTMAGARKFDLSGIRPQKLRSHLKRGLE